MPFRIVSEPPRNVVQLGEPQSFRLVASGGAAELERIRTVEWECLNDPSTKGNKIFDGPKGVGATTWDNVRWTREGDHLIAANIDIDGRTVHIDLPVHVVGPGEVVPVTPKRRRDIARRFRVVADPPLRTVSPEQQMTFRLELTVNDQRAVDRVQSVKWYCVNDPSPAGLAERPWTAGSYVFGGMGLTWSHAEWDFTGHHRVLAVIDYDGARIDLEYPVHVITLQAIATMAPAFGEEPDAPEVVDRQTRTLIKVIRDIETRQSAPAHKQDAYEARMQQRDDYAKKLRTLLDGARGKERFPIRAQYYSPHNAQPGGTDAQWMTLNVFVCEYEPGYWTLVDWTNPAGERTSGAYDGWSGNRHRSVQEALSGWDWHNKYPEGVIVYEWYADHVSRPLRPDRNGQRATGAIPMPGRFDTNGASLADEVSAVFDYIALGAAAVAGVVTLIAPVPGSRVVSAGIWTAIFTSTAAATINIATRHDNGFSNARDDAFDALTIAANLLGAGAMVRTGTAMRVMQRGAVVTSRSLAMTRGVIFASFGVDAIQGVMIAEKSMRDIDQIDLGSIWIPGSYMSNNSSSAPNKAFPRRLILWTNSKNPQYNGKYACEMPRCGRRHDLRSDQKPSMVLT